jgi:hypothetical protein
MTPTVFDRVECLWKQYGISVCMRHGDCVLAERTELGPFAE